MKILTAFVLLVAGCANSPPSDPVQDQDQTVDDAGDASCPRVREYCPPNRRPLFFVGSPFECQTIRFDCPAGTHYVGDEECGCGCDY